MRLFAAAWPAPEVVEALRSVDRQPWPEVRWTTPEQWHVTLRYFGSAAPAADLDRALAGAAARCRPAPVEVGPAVRALGRSLLVVDVRGLEAVAQAVRDATDVLVGGPEDRPFLGHVTVARGRGRRAVVGRGAGAAVSGGWRVAEVTLVASELRPDRARYHVVGRYPLTG